MNESQEPNGLRVLRFESWHEFTSSIPDLATDDSVFRGQRNPNWKLQSHWERGIGWIKDHLRYRNPVQSVFYNGAYEANRDRYLHHFREHAKKVLPIGDSNEITDIGWWAIGRHFGLISPLLDWSHNPRVAAFFAYMDFAAWLLDGDPDNKEMTDRKLEIPYSSVWRFQKAKSICGRCTFDAVFHELPGINERQKAQEGVFTRILDGENFDLVSYLDSISCTHLLSRCDLPTNDVSNALENLHDEGIHYATMFPDFWGAAMYANTRRFVKPESLREILGGDLQGG